MRHRLAIIRLLPLLALTLFIHGTAHSAESRTAAAPLAVGVAFDGDGRLWRVRVVDGYLRVDVSDDRGNSYSTPVNVTRSIEPIAAHGDLRPEIVLGGSGTIYVAWTSPLPQPYAGNIRFARSLDSGKSFEAPITVNDNHDAITHRFQTLHVAPGGRITMVWIDKRDAEASRAKRQTYLGAALYYAVSDNGGASFDANGRFAAHTCECCRIALAADTDGQPVAFWRHVFADGTRDHVLARVGTIAEDKEPSRATADRWKVNACPHHGPDLAVAADGTRHGAWFNLVAGAPGLFYGSWNKNGRPLGQGMRIGEPNAGHPSVLMLGQRLLLAWKSFNGAKTIVSLMESPDGGRHWSESRTLATAMEASDHPRLLAHLDQAYLSWSTAKEGHRLIPIPSGKLSGQ